MQNLDGMTNSQLVEYYNGLGPVKPIKQWKGKKSVLIARIHTAEKQGSAVEKSTAPDARGGSSVTPSKGRAAEPKADKPKKKTGAIRQLACALLKEVSYYEDKNEEVGPHNRVAEADSDARPVGLTFAEILAKVKAEFPEAKTSYACLRWYGVHLRNAGVVLPRRPKSSWK